MATRHYNINTVFGTATWKSLPLIPMLCYKLKPLKKVQAVGKVYLHSTNSLNLPHTLTKYELYPHYPCKTYFCLVTSLLYAATLHTCHYTISSAIKD